MAEDLVVRMVVLEWCFEIWLLVFVGMFGIGLLIGYGDVEEPPLLFQEDQPHVRSFGGWGGV